MLNNSTEIELAHKLIKESKNIYISSHVQPDGDNIGSILALALALKKIRDNVYILKSDEIPSDYLFLPEIDMIKEYEEISGNIDLFIALDCGDIERLGKNKELALSAKNILNIDHHKSNTNFGDINIVSPYASATAEMIFTLIKELGIEIDKDIATCIYTGISTDTGSFIYSNTSSKTHEVVADLLKVGIDKEDININLYQNKSLQKTKLFVNSLNNLETYLENKIAIVKVTQSMLLENQAKMEDTEGIVSFIRDIENVEVACLLKEYALNEIKVSIRSKRYIDVSCICDKFNGGGHIRAAGCTIHESIDKAKELILKEIMEAFR